MKKITVLLIMLFLGVVLTTSSQAAIKKLAQTGLQFLKADVGTRAAAMGGAYTMVGNDVTAMFYNPAGLAYLQPDYQLFVTNTQWIADIQYNAGGFAMNLSNWGVVGVSFIFADYGDDIIGTRVAATEAGYEDTGTLDVGAYAIGISYGRQISNKFAIGGQVKLAAQHLGESQIDSKGTVHNNKVSGMAFDFGTLFYPGFHSFRFGMYIRNFSPQFEYEKEAFQLPLTFSIGFAMDILDLTGEHENSLILSLDALHPRDYTERIHLGAEYVLMDMFAFRGGYKFNYDEEGLTGGVGFKLDVGGFNVDIGYAYADFGVFSSVNRISATLSF